MAPPRKISPVQRLVIVLALVLVVLPAFLVLAGAIAQLRWRAAHPALTVVPDVKGLNPTAAESTIQAVNLKTTAFSVELGSRCWATQPAVDTVFGQTPDALMPVLPGTVVRLEIAVENKK